MMPPNLLPPALTPGSTADLESAIRDEADYWAYVCASKLAAGHDGIALAAARRYRSLIDTANSLNPTHATDLNSDET